MIFAAHKEVWKHEKFSFSNPIFSLVNLLSIISFFPLIEKSSRF